MKKQTMVCCIILILLLITLTMTGQGQLQTYRSSERRIIYVDDDNVNGPWYGTLEYPFKYISWGLGAAFNGDLVYVFNGLYEESTFDVYNQITIQGEDPTNTIVDGGGYCKIRIYKPNVVLTGFTIRKVRAIYPFSHHITITNNIITDCSSGIFMHESGSSNITISHNVIKNNPKVGIKVWYNNYYTTYANNTFINNPRGIELYGGQHHSTIENNHFQSNNIGVLIWDDVHHLTITNNIFEANSNIGLDLVGYWDDVHHITITNNIFEANSNTGLDLGYTTNSIISKNTFINNNRGLFLEKATGNKITKNNFIGNTEHATFRYYEKREQCYWRYNYWDNWFKFFSIPRLIKGVVRYYDYMGDPIDRTWFNIDWRPALKPYDITITKGCNIE